MFAGFKARSKLAAVFPGPGCQGPTAAGRIVGGCGQVLIRSKRQCRGCPTGIAADGVFSGSSSSHSSPAGPRRAKRAICPGRGRGRVVRVMAACPQALGRPRGVGSAPSISSAMSTPSRSGVGTRERGPAGDRQQASAMQNGRLAFWYTDVIFRHVPVAVRRPPAPGNRRPRPGILKTLSAAFYDSAAPRPPCPGRGFSDLPARWVAQLCP